MNLGIWLPVVLAIAGGLGALVAHFWLGPQWGQLGNVLGGAVGVVLLLIFLGLVRYVPIFYSLLRPRAVVQFVSFAASHRFRRNEKPRLSFKFIRRKIGGRDILREVVRRLSKGRVVIWETGGLGKTALAAAALCRMHAKLSGGSLWLSADQRDLTSFLTELAILLGCPGAKDLRTTVRMELFNLGPCLLVVDNLETADQEAISFLMREVPANCYLLTTTRRVDKLAQEELGSLFRFTPTEQEAREFGEEFLKHRAKERGTLVNSETETAILDTAKGNPKAIELLLGQIEARGSKGPIEDIKLGEGAVLDNIIGRSFDLLSDDEKQVLCALSLFSPYTGKVSLADVAQVGSVDRCLEELWKWRLTEHDNTGERWWVSDQVGSYLRVRLKVGDLWLHFVRHFLTLAEQVAQKGDRYEANRALDEQRPNLFRAMNWCLDKVHREDEAGRKEAASLLVRFVRALHEFFYYAGYWGELLKYASEAKDIACPLLSDKGIAGDVAYILGMAYENKSSFAEAEKLYKEAFALKEELGDKTGMARVLHQLGVLAQWMGKWPEADSIFTKSLSLRREAADTRGVVFALHRLGMLAHDQGHKEKAKQSFDKALKLAKELGDEMGIAINLDQLGLLAHKEGDLGEAGRLYRQSFELKIAARHERGTAYSLDRLGALAYDQRKFKDAERLFNESLTVKRRLGDERGIAYTLHQMGRLAQERGKTSKAEQLCADSLRIRKKLEDKKGIAETLVEIAKLREKQGNDREAMELLLEARVLFQGLGSGSAVGYVERYLAQLEGKKAKKKP